MDRYSYADQRLIFLSSGPRSVHDTGEDLSAIGFDMNYPVILDCGQVQWVEEIGYVYETCIYVVNRGVAWTPCGGCGSSFVADVTRARQSPGDSGNRVNM